MQFYYVVCDDEDPGCEFETWEEAAEYCRECQLTHSPGAVIVGGPNKLRYGSQYDPGPGLLD